MLNPSSKIEGSKNILEQSFKSPLKEARKYFETEYLTTQLKNITEIYLKQLILLVWKDPHFIEN